MELKDAHRQPATQGQKDPRRESTPEIYDAFKDFAARAFSEGALPEKTKELIALACAHVTQSPGCIRSHIRRALRCGATRQEMMEAIWIAAVMRSGGVYQHAKIAITAMDEQEAAAQVRSPARSGAL